MCCGFFRYWYSNFFYKNVQLEYWEQKRSMAVQFKIEEVFRLTGRGYIVAAKLIEEGNGFWLPENSKLGKIEITNYLTQISAKDENGNLRTDLWGFKLKNESDFEKLKKGEIVELFPGDEIKFLPPWIKIESNGSFEKELEKEISSQHKLFGKEFKAIAKKEDCDDVFFEIGKNEMAIVHLT